MKNILIFSCLIVVISCKEKGMVFSNNEKTATVYEVQLTLDSYANDIRDKGLMAELKYLDSSNDFFWVPPGYRHALNYDTVKTIISRNAWAFKKVDSRWDTLQIIPLTESIATYTGRLRSEMTDIHDSTNVYSMLETGTMIKRANGWKLLSGQTNMLQQ